MMNTNPARRIGTLVAVSAGRVLEPFVKRARVGGHDSSGLGLAVVDAVARAHGGEVRIDTGPEGTTVRLVLPVVRPG